MCFYTLLPLDISVSLHEAEVIILKTSIRKPLVFLVIIIFAGRIVEIVTAGSIDPATKTVRNHGLEVRSGFPPPWDWATDQWTGNDKPFLDAKAAIDVIAENGTLNRSTVDVYQEQARKNPKEPVAQYRWGYAFESALNNGVPLGTIVQKLDTSLDIEWGMQQAPAPHSYGYTRLLFLIAARQSMYKLIPLARRLLKHTPNDYDVEFYFYPSLLASASPAERKEGLLGAKQLIQKYPDHGGPYGALAEVYSAQWEKGDIASGPLAVATFQKYLSLSPKGLTPQDRKGLEYWMNFIKTHPNGPKGQKNQ
jgi:hypothetical protein